MVMTVTENTFSQENDNMFPVLCFALDGHLEKPASVENGQAPQLPNTSSLITVKYRESQVLSISMHWKFPWSVACGERGFWKVQM